MPKLCRCLFVLIFLLFTSASIAEPYRLMMSTKDYQIYSRQYPSKAPAMAAFGWAAHVHKSNLLMRWTCVPFVHTEDRSVISDASMLIGLRKSNGLIRYSINQAEDRTHIERKDTEASIDMQVHGTGTVEVDMEISLPDPEAPGGQYCGTVVLTVTCP